MSPEVVVQVVVTPAMIKSVGAMTETAIQNAIARAKARIEAAAIENTPVGDPSNYGYTSTGRTPGTLLSSFQIGSTPRSIVMKWNALNTAYQNFNYTETVEQGRAGWHPFGGRYFGAATKTHARDIIMQELARELQGMSTS